MTVPARFRKLNETPPIQQIYRTFFFFSGAFSSRDKDKREHRDRDENKDKEKGDSSKFSKEKEAAKVEIKSEEK